MRPACCGWVQVWIKLFIWAACCVELWIGFESVIRFRALSKPNRALSQERRLSGVRTQYSSLPSKRMRDALLWRRRSQLKPKKWHLSIAFTNDCRNAKRQMHQLALKILKFPSDWKWRIFKTIDIVYKRTYLWALVKVTVQPNSQYQSKCRVCVIPSVLYWE